MFNYDNTELFIYIAVFFIILITAITFVSDDDNEEL